MWSIFVGRRPARTLARALALVITSVVVFGWILLPVRAEGISMQPTFEPGSLHVLNRLAYWRRHPARGDIVGIRLAGPHVVLVKRVIGLPGERVRITDGQVFVDGRPLEEPYVKRRNRSWTMAETKLGPDDYFVVGDNREMPMASHELGIARRERLVGKLVF
jgi:signal peptidase I